jgi:hypothetical protein
VRQSARGVRIGVTEFCGALRQRAELAARPKDAPLDLSPVH